MKWFLILTVLATFVYSLYLPIGQHATLHAGHRAMAEAKLERAGEAVASLGREWPNFVETGTRSLREQLATRYRDRAIERCHQGRHVAGLRDFQTSAALVPSAYASAEVSSCRLAYALALADINAYDEAMNQLLLVGNDGDGLIHTVALKQAVAIARKEMDFWLDRGQYAEAFEQFSQRRHSLGDRPEIALSFARLERQLERQVFGTALTQACHNGSEKRENWRPTIRGAIMVKAFLPGDDGEKSRLAIENETRDVVRLLLQGPESKDELLPAGGKKEMWVEGGKYVAAVFSPRNCEVRPLRAFWTLEPAMRHAVRIIGG